MKKNVSVVIPVFNAQEYLNKNILEILKVLESQKSWNSEIVLVNDGSRDNSGKICVELAKKNKQIFYVELSKNFGQQAATLAGISKAKFDLIITMDDDGQHPAGAIPDLLKSMTADVDVVYAVADVEEHSFWRNFLSRTAKNLLKYFLGLQSASELSAFRIFKRKLLNDFLEKKKVPVALDVLLHWNTSRITNISVLMLKRPQGKSNYNLRKLFRTFLNLITSYSIRPLRIASFLGLIGFIFSFIFSVIIFSEYFFGSITVPGYVSISLLISTLGSLQLLTLGILGEYLGKIHLSNLGKPFFRIVE